MAKPKNLRALISLGIGLVCLLALVLSIAQLKFLPGVPFSLETPPALFTAGGNNIEVGNVLSLVRGLAAIVTVLLVVYIVIHLLSPEGRKRLLADIIALLVIFGVVNLLSSRSPSPQQATPAPQDLSRPAVVPTSPVATFSANPPAWTDWVAILALAVLVTLVVVIIFRLTRRKPETSMLEQIAQQAEIALDQLREGGDAKNAILRCYLDMNRVVNEERHIQREQAMTPQEFMERLVVAGLPCKPVEQLTHLFEQVRYGSAAMGPREEQIAMDCLSTIISACRKQASEGAE